LRPGIYSPPNRDSTSSNFYEHLPQIFACPSCIAKNPPWRLRCASTPAVPPHIFFAKPQAPTWKRYFGPEPRAGRLRDKCIWPESNSCAPWGFTAPYLPLAFFCYAALTHCLDEGRARRSFPPPPSVLALVPSANACAGSNPHLYDGALAQQGHRAPATARFFAGCPKGPARTRFDPI